MLDEGTEAGGVQSRRLLGLAGYALLSRMGRAVLPTAGVIRRGALDGMAMSAGHCGRGRACVEMAGDAFSAHAMRVHEGEQRDGHPQHA